MPWWGWLIAGLAVLAAVVVLVGVRTLTSTVRDAAVLVDRSVTVMGRLAADGGAEVDVNSDGTVRARSRRSSRNVGEATITVTVKARPRPRLGPADPLVESWADPWTDRRR